MPSPKKLNVRLPRNVKPERYRLVLHPDLKRFTFQCEETAYLNLAKPTREIVLHGKDLRVSSAKAARGKEEIKAKKISYDAKAETITFSFPWVIPKGKIELQLEFTGTLNDQMRGFYRSRYEKDGKEHWLATTQFEATDARRAFLCVDEPEAKAVFDVTLMTPRGHTAISNTLPVHVAEHESGYQIVKFAPTPKMSTYLLVFIVGDFEFVEKKTSRGTLVRVFVTPGKKHQAMFALDVAAKVLTFFENYFAIKYPLPVLDMIAIPDFSAGAMENWGAVTYRESAILFDPKHSSTGNKQWIALVISHELAHQWFGNLVTMEWWTHLWLNEGFASYIEYLAVDHLFPEWDIWTQFVVLDLGAALNLDALKNTHPIEVEVHHPSEISEIFDAVSYQKGASIIRMLADYLGEKSFRDGLRHYLKKHAYANARTEDLWLALEHVTKKPVRKIMAAWTGKAGYPLVRAKETKKGVVILQSRFFSSAIIRKQTKDSTVWNIPINFLKESASKPERFLLDKREKPFPVRLEDGEWVSLNAGASGVYRVDYPAPMLHRLREAIEERSLSARERLAIGSDTFSLAESSELPTTEALLLAKAYKEETDYSVWSDLDSHFSYLEGLLADENFLDSYRTYLRGIYQAIAKRMGWEKKKGEKHTDSLLRSLALWGFGSRGEDENTVKEAKRRFRELQKGKHLDPDIRGVVYGLAAQHGGKAEYDWFVKRHQAERLNEEKVRLLRTLGRFSNTSLLRKTLNYTFSKHVRTQDDIFGIQSVAGNPKGRGLAWNFVKANWKKILERHGRGGHVLPNFVKVAQIFNTKEKAKDVREFFRTHEAPGAIRAVEQTIERIESKADWLSRDRTKIREWLKNTKI
ncbi:MAG: M1 family metallopeptidase [Candidatus Sungbacteria bacterium]|nr:M1 family metallopeptidase [Candidatus Sungbacteria bacterium]